MNFKIILALFYSKGYLENTTPKWSLVRERRKIQGGGYAKLIMLENEAGDLYFLLFFFTSLFNKKS